MNKRVFLLILLLVLTLCTLGAKVSVRDITSEFPPERYQEFFTGETVEQSTLCDDNTAKIAFDGTLAKEKAVADYNAENAFCLAIATMIPYPEKWSSLTEEEAKLEVINTLLSVSTIKGITYISHAAGEKPKVLFEDAYTVTDAKKKKQATDAQFTSAPKSYEYEVFANLKDSIFGSNIYSIKYQIADNEVFMKITNLSDLKFLFYKCVGKEELDMCVDVVMTEEGFAVFALATVYGREPQVKTPVTTVDLPSAFVKRITSLKNWFAQEIAK